MSQCKPVKHQEFRVAEAGVPSRCRFFDIV
jgi:hypothetical protein